MSTIISEASKILKEVAPIIENHYGVKLPKIEIEASTRMTNAFGKAVYYRGRYIVKIASRVYSGKTDTRAFRNTTVHEIAHIAEHVIFERFSHSADWAKIMQVCGEKADRFATAEKKAEVEYVRAPKRKMTKYVHKCAGGCSHNLSPQKHNKLMKGGMYVCKKTHTTLLRSFETVKV